MPPPASMACTIYSTIHTSDKVCQLVCCDLPSEEFELTSNTLRAHMKTHGKVISKPLIYRTGNSQDVLTLSNSHRELAVGYS